MLPTRNTRSLKAIVAESEAALRDLLIARPQAWWHDARLKLQDLPKNNYQLGCSFMHSGQLRDAILRFRIALALRPNYPQAWYTLGCSYFRLGENAKAAQALKKALMLAPGHTDALFMLSAVDPASVTPERRPSRMPKATVIEFFTSVAATYDTVELENRYQGGQLVFDLLKPMLKKPDPVVVDLGCGSGIAARPWRTLAARIVGVEMTPAMRRVAQAMTLQQVPLFNEVIEADLATDTGYVPAASAQVVLCINVASYVGDLTRLIATASAALASGGVFAITTEQAMPPHTQYGLSPESGRFTHAAGYVKQLAQQSGLTVAREQRVELYPGISSQLQVFSKP